MSWLEITLLAIAAIVIATNQALSDAPNLTDRFKLLRTRRWANYVPVLLMFGALLIWAVRLLPAGSPGVAEGANPPVANMSHDPAAVRLAHTNFPIDHVTGFYRTSAKASAERSAAPFVGWTAEIEGRFDHVIHGDDSFYVRLVRGPADTIDLSMKFSARWAGPLELLQKGDAITASCTFRGSAGPEWIGFDDCRLLGH